MAFAHQGYYGTVNMRDQGMNPTRIRVRLQGLTIGAAGSALADFVAKLGAVTDAWIESYQFEDVWTTDVLFTAAEPHGEASTKAVLSMQLTTPGKSGTFAIPAPKDSIFTALSGAGYNIVDFGVTAVSDLVNTFAAGGDAYISDGENVVSGGGIKGVRVHRKHRDA